MIESVLPRGVAAAEYRGHLAEPLFPAEVAAISRAVEKRQREFRTVRACARMALAQLGVDRPPMVPGPHGEPCWPRGLVGSMTHCAGYAAAVVARREVVLGLGVDAEPHGPLPEGVLDLAARPEERRGLADLAQLRPHVHVDRLLFSAKESVYKAWFPVVGQWLGFEDVRVTFAPDDTTFVAQLLVPGLAVGGRGVTELTGRWAFEDGMIVTLVTLPTDDRIDPGQAPNRPVGT